MVSEEATLGSAVFRAVNTKSDSTEKPKVESLVILGGDADVDQFISCTRSVIAKFVGVSIVYGDTAQTSDRELLKIDASFNHASLVFGTLDIEALFVASFMSRISPIPLSQGEWASRSRSPRRVRKAIRPEVRHQIISVCAYQCQYCLEKGDNRYGPDGKSWHIDHIVPWSKGGSDDESNLTLACATCNNKKRARSVDVFLDGQLFRSNQSKQKRKRERPQPLALPIGVE